MAEQIKIGTSINWTLQSAKDAGIDNEEFFSFIDENLTVGRNNPHIAGTVIDILDGTAIIKVSEMTEDMFPFTVFYNEVKNWFFSFEIKEIDPYQKYFCLNINTMVSLFFYYEGEGFLGSAELDDDGKFDCYEAPNTYDGQDMRPQLSENAIPEQINVELSAEDIELYENKDAFYSSDDIPLMDESVDMSAISHPCSVARATSWFTTRDCAILTAWRGEKSRKTNDENNRKLQQRLRELGYGVTQATSYQGASPSQRQTFVLTKPFSGKSTSSAGEQERVGWLPANTVPISDCDSACKKREDSFPPTVTA